MALARLSNIVLSVMLPIMFSNTSEAIKCFDCNSRNNSACLEMHIPKMHAIVPIVDCAEAMGNSIDKKEYFCRKITQTILDPDHTPEVRITRGCGWVKSKRQCYKADNMDHLETVCQCFGDLCNAATSLPHVKVTAVGTVASLLAAFRSWSGSV
ncbi:hypothetical protein PYW07_005405 [Mythimna separata]|uniref:Protein sleepless n=1 Tax=Mythimna separata TaxID=271217 RepID=A0AAD7YFR5_MYTSE|nr:hypothetical protein PYW07_005405 [Mythimna separata]